MIRKQKFYLFAFMLFAIFNINCAYYNTLFNAKKSYKAGIEIIQKEPDKETHPQADKYFEETIDKCWKLIELYSDKSKYADDAFLYIIKSEFYIRKYAQAKSHANQFLLKYPKSELIPEANLWYGKLLLKDKEIEQGKEYLFKVINFSNNSKLKAEAFYELGNLAFENKDYPDAIQYFEKASNEKIDKQYAAFINFYLGESYFQQKQYKEAIKQYRKVEKFSPSLDVEYRTSFNLGKCYSELEEYGDALSTFRKMLTAPRFKNFIPFIKNEIATIYYLQEKVDQAIELYREIVKEKIPNAGTAQASLNLARIFEYDIQNIDSAVYYYGEVKKIYSKYDSLQLAEDKFYFLSELKKLKDNILRDQKLIYKLENDSYFRDSLYTAQLEDSLLQHYGPSNTATQFDTSFAKIDTNSILYKKNIYQLDSLLKALSDTLALVQDDSLRKPPLEDSLQKVKLYLQYKTPKTEKTVERRKLPQIQEDLKASQFHLAEFFLLQIQDYDSAIVHYNNFCANYTDSILTPKAMYSLYFIYSQPEHPDQNKADSLHDVLLLNYPDSPFAHALLKKPVQTTADVEGDSLEILGHAMFLKAEEFYYNREFEQALDLYKEIAALDSSLIWSAKAQFARAWIFEKELNNIDSALYAYNELKNKFPQTEFVALASKKVMPSAQIIPDQMQVTSDTTLLSSSIIDTTISSDLTGPLPPQSNLLPAVTISLPPISKPKEYREWRRNRSVKN